MNAAPTRVFVDKDAVREATPLLVGLTGPSGGGKTCSALRLATGIQRVTGGDIYGIDTESRRMLHYADQFKFRHLDFRAPFGPLDYLAAIEHCVHKGGRVIIVDSMSHEHEGPGGVLEQHAEETTRLAKAWGVSEAKAQISAWAGPKQARRRMINSILQLNANFLFAFRAKEKLKIVTGKDPVQLGYMAIAAEELTFEMTINLLLMPGSKGTPIWASDYPGERQSMKLPRQFEELFVNKVTGEITERQIDEAMGEKLARWAAGDQQHAGTVEDLINAYPDCDEDGFAKLESARKELWPKLPASDSKERLQKAAHAAGKRLGIKV